MNTISSLSSLAFNKRPVSTYISYSATGNFSSLQTGGKQVVIFDASTVAIPAAATFTISQSVTARILIAAAGGMGGFGSGGGGGGGGVLEVNTTLAAGTYNIYVGKPVIGNKTTQYTNATGMPGENSQFGTYTANGGGGGASGGGYAAQTLSRLNGGSGGGGAGAYNSGSTTFTAGGTGVSGQGNAGGTYGNSQYGGPGGGGGAGQTGSAGTFNSSYGNGGNGGNGVINNITGTNIYYGAGGGGGGGNAVDYANRIFALAGTGGLGGGGRGGAYDLSNNTTGPQQVYIGFDASFGPTIGYGGGGGGGGQQGGYNAGTNIYYGQAGLGAPGRVIISF